MDPLVQRPAGPGLAGLEQIAEGGDGGGGRCHGRGGSGGGAPRALVAVGVGAVSGGGSGSGSWGGCDGGRRTERAPSLFRALLVQVLDLKVGAEQSVPVMCRCGVGADRRGVR